MTFSPILSQIIQYYSINYERKYDGGKSDLTGFFIAQSCIS